MLASLMIVVGLCSADPQAPVQKNTPNVALQLLEEGTQKESFEAFMQLSRDPGTP